MTSFLSENVLVPLKCEGLCREGALGWVGGRDSVPVVLRHRPAGTAMAAGNPSPATALGKAAPVRRRAAQGSGASVDRGSCAFSQNAPGNVHCVHPGEVLQWSEMLTCPGEIPLVLRATAEGVTFTQQRN